MCLITIRRTNLKASVGQADPRRISLLYSRTLSSPILTLDSIPCRLSPLIFLLSSICVISSNIISSVPQCLSCKAFPARPQSLPPDTRCRSRILSTWESCIISYAPLGLLSESLEGVIFVEAAAAQHVDDGAFRALARHRLGVHHFSLVLLAARFAFLPSRPASACCRSRLSPASP